MKNINAVKYDRETMIDYVDAWNYAHSRRGEVSIGNRVRVATYMNENEGFFPYVYKEYINGKCLYENVVLDSFLAYDENTEKSIEKAKRFNLSLIRAYRHVFNREQFFALFNDYPKKG